MAFQTSCVSAANIVTGLTFQQDVVADAEGREMVQHGSSLFPIACYAENLKSYSVAWHWHEEFEYILAMKGPLTVDVNKTRVTLQTNQGRVPELRHPPRGGACGKRRGPAPLGRVPPAAGGRYGHHLLAEAHPAHAPAGCPGVFLLDGAVPWQAQVLACLREAWQAVAVEPFDYENRVRYYLSAALRLLSTQCVGGKTKVSQQEQIAAERMKQMLRFVEEHYAEELTVELIAGSVALSESACLRSFRQMLGITPIQYVKQFRVEKAAELLRSTRLKTGEIGMECGFADGSYFIKIFREIKSTAPPREYRIRFFVEFSGKRGRNHHAAYFNGRVHHAEHPAVRPAFDVRNPFAADVQYRRHVGGRPLPRRGCAGGRGLLVHADDVPHVHPAGPLHGQRCGHLDAVWQRRGKKMRNSVFQSFVLIAGMALALNLLIYLGLGGILWVLRVPAELQALMKQYLVVIFMGIFATFFCITISRTSCAPSATPWCRWIFLAVSAILNVVLDLLCVIVLGWGVAGAAGATVFSQYVSGVGIGLYTLKKSSRTFARAAPTAGGTSGTSPPS